MATEKADMTDGNFALKIDHVKFKMNKENTKIKMIGKDASK